MSATQKVLFALGLACALSACKKEAPVEAAAPPPPPSAPAEPAMAPPPPAMPAGVEIVAVNLGTQVGADQKVAMASTHFAANDVIYIAIDTKNAEKDVFLAVKVTSADGKIVHEEGTQISPEGNATNNFKFSGLAAGKYKVETSLNGTSAQSVEFEVK